VRPKTLDHVALWTADRDGIAELAERELGMHVIERTDRFTLIGADARRGKLTLFEAEGPRVRGALLHVGLRVGRLDGRPPELRAGDGLVVRLVEAPTDLDFDLDHVALLSRDPESTARSYVDYGFSAAPPTEDGQPRVEVGGAFVEFHPGEPGEPERPLLNHLAVLVDSAEDHRAGADARGIEIDEVVDAPNTLAVFVWLPERVRLEYVEHKPTFSLR
jgi:catechol 2,3-dioxygenase-like lactoylglutathione lyase family enzyme